MSNQDRFFKFFRGEVTGLQDRMQKLETLTPVERIDAVDSCLAGIANLTRAVKDASAYLPAYDQRTYSDAIKALSDKLQKSRASFAPRKKFSFKSGDYPRKNASALSVADAAALADARLQASRASSTTSSIAPTPLSHSMPGTPGISTPPDVAASTKDTVVISSKTNQCVTFETSGITPTTSTATLANLDHCVVDLSSPPASAIPKHLSALYLKSVHSSLLICAHVDGAAYLTDIHDSVLLISCRQFRMHESTNCRIYLYCPSHPIVEDCQGLGFAPLEGRSGGQGSGAQNMWDRVDDFKWLKAEKSPNWGVLREEERLSSDVLEQIQQREQGRSVQEMLTAVGVKSTQRTD